MPSLRRGSAAAINAGLEDSTLAEATNIVHLIVDAGPDKGRPLSIPPTGARIGRSSQNDIELTDPSVSRFQCRVFFKPDELLWIADLGSTNETLVNNAPVLESKLNIGDRIEIGETVIRVVTDRLHGHVAPPPVPPPVPAPAPEPPPFAFPPATPEPPAPERIDLGLQKNPYGDEEQAPRKVGKRKWLWLLLVAMIVMTQVAVMKSDLFKRKAPGSGAAVRPTELFAIYYEKVQGSSSNIFRYELELVKGHLAVRIDSLNENRHITREKQVAKEVLKKLSDDIERDGFFQLDREYKGLNPNAYESADLEIEIGNRTHRSLVLNRVEPQEFTTIREKIEEFAKNELGLITISLSPDRLLQLARDASLQGQKLFGEREIKYDNLWNAIRAYEEAQIYLETIEPKPDFYPTIVSGLTESRKELDKQHQNYLFLADKSIRMADWKTASDNLRIIKEIIPDRNDTRHTDAEKKLVDVERRIKR